MLWWQYYPLLWDVFIQLEGEMYYFFIWQIRHAIAFNAILLKDHWAFTHVPCSSLERSTPWKAFVFDSISFSFQKYSTGGKFKSNHINPHKTAYVTCLGSLTAVSTDPSRDLDARQGWFGRARGGLVMHTIIIYTWEMIAKSLSLLPGGNARGEPPVTCCKHLKFLLPVNIQL